MSTISDRDLQDQRRETEAAVLAAVKAAAERAIQDRVADTPDVPESNAADLLTIVRAWQIVAGKPSKPTAALRG